MIAELKRKLHIQTIENGKILPLKPACSNTEPIFGLGGVIDSHNVFVRCSATDNGWCQWGGEYIASKSPLYIDEKVIYLGLVINHWGHFLIDCLGRFWYLTSANYKNEKIVIVTNSESVLQPIKDFMRLLGVSDNVIVLSPLSKPLNCRTIIIPESAYIPGKYYHSAFKKVFEIVSRTALSSNETPSMLYDKVYFSRQHLQIAKKKEFGELEIQKQLENNDFKIFYPEELSLTEQIKIWNNADSVAAINGTIPLNLCFLNHDSRIYVLNKTIAEHNNLYDFASIFNVNILYIDCYYKRWSNKNILLGTGPFLMCLTDEFTQQFGGIPVSPSIFNRYKFLRALILLHLKSFVKAFLFKTGLLPIVSKTLKRQII